MAAAEIHKRFSLRYLREKGPLFGEFRRFAQTLYVLYNTATPRPLTPTLSAAYASVDLALPTMTSHLANRMSQYSVYNELPHAPDVKISFVEETGRRNVREYHRRYPNRRTPNHQAFKNIERRLRENGMLKVNRRNAGRPRQARTILVEEEILERVDEIPETSVRLLKRQNTLPDLFDDLPLKIKCTLYTTVPHHILHVLRKGVEYIIAEK
ncbi:hypothetical protein NQ318_011998 [Aromia moschata]|uniref:Uncharacterized protein n=1 Tax=Aromia moschata TaxID=1265417 RepID=A0AAV8XHG9_9CUCU|nr:hypothetical protein NQ318_011998 [Aromia moschata]